MFAWGCGPCLGTGSVDATSARPRLIDELQSTCVIDIAVGDSHCLALSKGWCSVFHEPFEIALLMVYPSMVPYLLSLLILIILLTKDGIVEAFY